MVFIKLTRPDGPSFILNPAEIVSCTPVGDDSKLPPGQGTRINLKGGVHQDVKELVAEVAQKLGAV